MTEPVPRLAHPSFKGQPDIVELKGAYDDGANRSGPEVTLRPAASAGIATSE